MAIDGGVKDPMERAIGNDATRKMVTRIASEAVQRITSMPAMTDDLRRGDAALDFIVGYMAGIRACGFEMQANRLAGEFAKLVGPEFYGEVRKLVEEGRKMRWQ